MDSGLKRNAPDQRWIINAAGEQLVLRKGMRARYTFGARVSELGGRTFEWWVETLESEVELAYNGGPLWVAREVTAKAAACAIFARADLTGRIIGRAVGRAGNVTGPSTPHLMWRAVERYCGLDKRKFQFELVVCGLTHPKVQELLVLTSGAAQLPQPANNSIGLRAGGLSELKDGGSQLRAIRRLAGDAFVRAMESDDGDECSRIAVGVKVEIG